MLWREILEQVPDSRLFLKNHTVDIPYGRKCLEDRLRQTGITADRVMLEGYSDNFLSAYSRIDIALIPILIPVELRPRRALHGRAGANT